MHVYIALKDLGRTGVRPNLSLESSATKEALGEDVVTLQHFQKKLSEVSRVICCMIHRNCTGATSRSLVWLRRRNHIRIVASAKFSLTFPQV